MISCDDQPQVINSNGNHVPSHTLSGWIKDADMAEPLAKIVIEIEEVDRQYQPLDTLKRVETDSKGFFLFPKLVPGSYWVSILREKHLVYQQTSVILPSKYKS